MDTMNGAAWANKHWSSKNGGSASYGCDRYDPEGTGSQPLTGSARHHNVYGFDAVELNCSNSDRIERTQRDVCTDGMEHFYALIPLAGRSTIIHDGKRAEMSPGDISLIDSTRPVKYVCNNTPGRWLSLHIPRQSLISHLGFEPRAGSFRHRGTLAGRLLSQLASDAVKDGGLSFPSEPYMQLAIYDLIGALFADSDPATFPSHTDKLFTRVRCTSSRDVHPIQTLARAKWRPQRESRYDTCRSCSPAVARPAVTSYNRFGWTTRRSLCVAAPR